MNSEDQYDVEILSLVYGGDAFGRLPDGRAVFVPFALPGEKVRLQLTQQKRNYAKAKLIEVLEPSAVRIQPRCKHFGVCGGCHYQQISYEHQVEIKADILREQLERIAGIKEPPVNPLKAAPQPWNYRNTMQYHLTKQGELGFIASGSDNVIPIQECHLPLPSVDQVWRLLDMEPLADIDRIEVRAGAEDEILLTLESSNSNIPEFLVDLSISAVHLGPEGITVLSGDDYVVMDIKNRLFQVTAGSFFQVNTDVATAMVDTVLKSVPKTEQSVVFDIYCGGGLFSAFIAPLVSRCIGIEISPLSVGDFVVNLDEFENIELYEGATEDVLPGLKLKPDIVIVDPPRSGLGRVALDALVGTRSPVILYVSCDPATLARDTKRMISAGYDLGSVTPFDMFPQTSHIESISYFSLR